MSHPQVGKRDAQVVAVLGVEARVVDQVDPTTDDVTGGEGRPVRLARGGRVERVPVVAMVTVRVFLPACDEQAALITNKYSLIKHKSTIPAHKHDIFVQRVRIR